MPRRRVAAATHCQDAWAEDAPDRLAQAFPQPDVEVRHADDEAPLQLSGLRGLQNAEPPSRLAVDPALLDTVSDRMWRGTEFGRQAATCWPTGFSALDAELPGGGWPLSTVSELLQPQFCQAEWRLLLPALASHATAKRPLLAIAPPHAPFFGGLRQYTLDEGSLVVIHAQAPAERLWATEQAVKANGLAGVIAWLGNARGDQVRRLQTCAAQCGFPIFLVRPESAQHESSAAPLRLQARLQGLHAVGVHVLKRRGPAHVGWMALPAAPPRLAELLPSLPPGPDGLVGRPPAAVARPIVRVPPSAQPAAPSFVVAPPPSHLVPSHVVADAPVDGTVPALASGH